MPVVPPQMMISAWDLHDTIKGVSNNNATKYDEDEHAKSESRKKENTSLTVQSTFGAPYLLAGHS